MPRCCGALLGIDAGLTDEKPASMKQACLDALATACPTCFAQFDTGRARPRRKDTSRRSIPVNHIAELVAYALGAEPERLDLKSHRTETPFAE
ncbi:MAG: hypothetical protein HZB55_10895 [Deltaproteobacteria bacterium]|nr:hypothetical protein [Deltaproteobacteria bacterium]